MMWKGIQPVILALSMLVVAGCRTKDYYLNKGPCPERPFAEQVKQELLQDKSFAGNLELGNIAVFYQDNLETQAHCIARQIDNQFSYLRNLTGFEMVFEQIRVYLIWKDKIGWIDEGQFIEAGGIVYGMILYVQRDDDSCEAIVAKNQYPYSFLHEVVENSLNRPCDSLPVLNDYQWGADGIQHEQMNYTRWFRDGFANYAGYLAHKVTVSDSTFNRGHIPLARIEFDVHEHPFLQLSEIGKDLFTWTQYTPDPLTPRRVISAPNLPKTNVDYYDAALGLFLLIEDKFGTEAIKKVIVSIDPNKPIDGPSLVRIFNKTLNTDIKELAENFYFPQTGLYLENFYPVPKSGIYTGEYSPDELDARWSIKDGVYDEPQSGILAAQAGITDGIYVTIVEPNSPADQAGIKIWDIIRRINGKEVYTNLDYEFAIYESMHQQSATVDIWRDEVGEVVVELQLTNLP